MNTFTEREWRLMAMAGAGGCIIGAALMFAAFPRAASETARETDLLADAIATSTDPAEAPAEAVIAIEDQPAGRAVRVRSVELSQTTWVAVHELREHDILGNVLGAVRRDAGAYENLIVNLLRGTEPNRRYAIVLYADDGDLAFDHKKDARISNEDNELITAEFTALTPVSPGGR